MARYTDEAMPGLVPRGRVVGGSSAVNAQIFLRGVPEDYDTWASWGNDRWSFEELMPYFRMIETDTDCSGDFHGSDGPIIVRRFKPDEWNPPSRAFYDAALANGFPECPDHNAPDTTGIGPTPLNNPGRVRWSTAIGYLSDARERPNLTIQPDCLVHKVLFDGKRAVGIRPRLMARSWTTMVRTSSSPPARSARRTCCSSPASDRRRVWMPSAFPCCTNCRAWAKTSAIIRRSGLFGGRARDSNYPKTHQASR